MGYIESELDATHRQKPEAFLKICRMAVDKQKGEQHSTGNAL